MKLPNLLLLIALLGFSSCDKDDLQNFLRYDGENFTGPNLDAGQHELAAYFPAGSLSGFVGKRLLEVRFFAGQLPEKCTVKVYGRGTGTTPGPLLYEAVVTPSVQVPAWNKHQLKTPVVLDGDDIWISIAVTHSQKQQSIGCDAGPRKEGGDWLFSSTDGAWKTFLDRTTDSVNWNIRGVVEE